MLSLTKSLFIGLALCFASVSWSLPASLKSCDANKTFQIDYKIVDKMLTLMVAGVDSAGKPTQAKYDYPIVATQPFTAADFTPEVVQNMLAIAEISSFTKGEVLALNSGGTKPSTLWFFEFQPDQHSVVWIVEGYPIVLGKTNTCN